MKGWTIAGLLLVALLLWIAYEYTQGSDPVSAVASIFEDDDSSSDTGDDDSSDNSGNSGAGGNVQMTFSQQALALAKKFEGIGPNGLLLPYKDAVGVWTIGYGSIVMPDGTPVTASSQLDSEQEADDLLSSELSSFGAWVNSHVTVPLNQSQFDAVLLWVFNVGENAMPNGASSSTSSLITQLNAGNYAGADSHFLDWVKGTVDGVKQVLGGLVNRETTLANLFSGGN